jgi:hypothetical protein
MKGIVTDLLVGTHGENSLPRCLKSRATHFRRVRTARQRRDSYLGLRDVQRAPAARFPQPVTGRRRGSRMPHATRFHAPQRARGRRDPRHANRANA